MIKDLDEKKYKVIKNFIPKQQAKLLGKEFIKYCNGNEVLDDVQVMGSQSVHNYIPFLEVLTQKVNEVSDLVGETVLPTYCYSRVYRNGNILENHVDRPSCEISLTIHLFGDSDWPIYIGEEEKEYITLKPGDAVLYLGNEVHHGREKFEGNEYVQCFLHYVRSRGNHSDNYFDNKNTSKSLIESDYIKVYDDVLSDELCDLIINEYKDFEWASANTSDNLVKTDIRKCSIIGISLPNSISKNSEVRKYIDTEIFSGASNVIKKYTQEFPHLEIDTDTGYDLLKYDKGDFYVEHIDYFKSTPRIVSLSFILNDNYEGGEFCFFGRKLKMQLKKGSAILFPSNFMYPHEILPVQNGTRYSIITWFK
jgi:hypothetical protein